MQTVRQVDGAEAHDQRQREHSREQRIGGPHQPPERVRPHR